MYQEINDGEHTETEAAGNGGLQDDHDPNDLGGKFANRPKPEKSQSEGSAAYAPRPEDEVVRSNPGLDPTRNKTGEF